MKKILLTTTLSISVMTSYCMNGTNLPININALNDAGHSALYYGVESNNLPAVKLLLENKANPNIPEEKKPPLALAIQNNNEDMVSLLLEYRASCNISTIEYAKKMEAGKAVVQLLLTSPGVNESLKQAFQNFTQKNT